MSSQASDIVRRHRLSVTQCERMAETGIFGKDARVELIDGEIIERPDLRAALTLDAASTLAIDLGEWSALLARM